MKIKIFTTSRQIRKWLEEKDNEFLDKFYTLGEFLERIVIVDNKTFIDKDLRKKYLFEAVKNVDCEKLGISREFIRFFDDSEFVFSFFNELFLERVDLNKVISNDVYLDYQEHLEILREIKNEYKNLLANEGYIDKFLIEEYRLNEGLLDGIEKIELKLDGYLSKFDIEVLKKINIPVEIYFETDRFNKSLLEKSFGISVEDGYAYRYDFKELKKTPLNNTSPIVSVEYFGDKIAQVEFIFAKIAEFVKSGIASENIAVILPDETFSEYIKLFDKYENLNFAMGESFTKSNLYITLKAIYEYLIGDEDALKKCEEEYVAFEKNDLIEFIKDLASNKELKVIDEELYKLEAFREMFESKKDFLFFILERFKNLRFDDVYSGKITCMGVLESRGMEFEGVILVDFNDDIVPNVSDNDLFLNTFIRKHSKLPTRLDKENLQKHYYYQLISNAKKVAIAYVKNEEYSPSRFLYELNLPLGENYQGVYEFFEYSDKKSVTEYSEKFEVKEPIYPTTLQTLIECPKRYYFSKILDITQETDDEFFGDIFHKSLETIKDVRSSKEYYNKLISEITSRIKDKKLLFEVLVKWEDKIKAFCEKDYKIRQNHKSLSERRVEFIFNSKRLAARVDRIDINDEEVVLIDYKTSKSASKKEEYPYEFQTTFYYLFAKKQYPGKKIKTLIWDIYEGKVKEGVIKEEILKDVLENLPIKVSGPNDLIIDGKIVKKAIDICKYCPYKIACGREI